MKKNNKLLFIFLILGRFFDIITTYISGNGCLDNEMNILVRVFNLGWNSLLFSEAIFILIAFVLLVKQTDSFYLEAQKKINSNVSFSEYFGMLYFGRKISFLKSLVARMKYKIFINSLIPILFFCTIVVSFLIGINNLLAGSNYYNLFSLSKVIFGTNNTLFQNNIVKILNFIVFVIITIIYHYKRYEKHIKNQDI